MPHLHGKLVKYVKVKECTFEIFISDPATPHGDAKGTTQQNQILAEKIHEAC